MPQWLIDFGNWLLDILKTMANTLLTMMKDVFLFAIEQLLILVNFILGTMGNLFEGLNFAQYFDGIPPEVAWVMSQIGFGQAMTMVIGSLIIRFFLQLIPFVRLGS
ncbi:MAG: VSK receptor [Gammaproteobacteria bacterium HGW-Gammaproteobacteria-15]|nr:MAG: VSK receptor [Gammaproteobacteria bacterium HGW-Gammaproteobacteria-15]